MKILNILISPIDQKSGATNAAYYLVKNLRKINDVDFAIPSKKNKTDLTSNVLYYPIFTIPDFLRFPFFAKYYYNVLCFLKGFKIFKKKKYDVVHFHNPHPPLILRQISKFFKKRDVKMVMSTHGIIEMFNMKQYMKLSKISQILFDIFVFKPFIKSLNHIDYFICSSEFEKEILLTNEIKENKIYKFPNGISDEFINKSSITQEKKNILKQKLGIETNTLIILTTANFSKNKGLLILLNAINKLKEKKRNFILLMTGNPSHSDYIQTLMDYINVNDLENYVSFLGYVSLEELIEYHDISDIFIYPTLSDTFPLSILEAMARKTPVISTNVGGIPEQIEFCNCGIIVEKNDSNGIFNAIIEIINNQEKFGRILEENHYDIINYFSWKLNAKKTLKLYKEIVDDLEK